MYQKSTRTKTPTLSKTRTDWGSEDGSTGSVTTPIERRMALEGGTDDAQVERIVRTQGGEKFAKELEAAR